MVKVWELHEAQMPIHKTTCNVINANDKMYAG